MIEVSETSKKLYTDKLDDSNMTPVYKIVFPDDSLGEITADNIMQESVELEQSLWEGSSMQLGGCISSIYRCTLFETEEDAETGTTAWTWTPQMLGKHIKVMAGYEETETICIYDGYIKEANRQKSREQISIICYDAMSVKFDKDVSAIYNNSFPARDRFKGNWTQGTAYKRGDIVYDENDSQYYIIWNNYTDMPAGKKAVENAAITVLKENSPSELVAGNITYEEQTGPRLHFEYEYGATQMGCWLDVRNLVRCIGTDSAEAYQETTCGELLNSIAEHCGYTGQFIVPYYINIHKIYKNMETTDLSAAGCIAQIAEAFGYCAMIDNNGDVVFKNMFLTTGTEIEEYENLTYSDFVLTPVDGVCVKSGENSICGPNSAEQCKNMYTIVDNFMFYGKDGKEESASEMLQYTYGNIRGFSYQAFEFSTFGMPWLEVGDTVKFTTPDGLEVITIIQTRTLTGTTGGFRDTFKAELGAAACNDSATGNYSSASQMQGSVNYYMQQEITRVENMEIEGSRIIDSTITGSKIEESTLQGSHFLDGTITGSKISDSTLTGSHFVNGSITGTKIDFSTFSNGVIKGTAIDTSSFTNGQISGSKIDSSTLTNIPFASINNAFVSELAANEIFTKALAADRTFTKELAADKAFTKELAADETFTKELAADSGFITELVSENGLFGELKIAGMLTADSADLRYTNIWLSNVQTEHVAELFAKVGLIDRATITEGHITGFLDAVEVNASNITAGTLTTDRLVIRGNTESVVYELNNITGALQAQSTNTLNGEIITDRTVTADKIVAKSITANEIDVASLFAQNVTASGTITGLTLKGAKAYITEGQIGDLYIGNHSLWSGTGEGLTQSTLYIGHDGINISKLLQIGASGSNLYCSNGIRVRDTFGDSNFAYMQEDIIGLFSEQGNVTISPDSITIGDASIQRNGYTIINSDNNTAGFITSDNGFELYTSGESLTIESSAVGINGKLYIGANKKLSMWEDSEGGNIQVNAPSTYGNYWQQDAFNGNYRFYTYDTNGNLQSCTINRSNGRVNKAEKAWGVADYNSESTAIKIGWAGAELTTTTHFAAYGTDSSGGRIIKNISVANAQAALGINTIKNIISPLETQAYVYCCSATNTAYTTSSYFNLNVAGASFNTKGASGAYTKQDNATIYLQRTGIYLCLATVSLSATKGTGNVKRLTGVFGNSQCANMGLARLQTWESLNTAFLVPVDSPGYIKLQFQDESGGGTVYKSELQIFKIS